MKLPSGQSPFPRSAPPPAPLPISPVRLKPGVTVEAIESRVAGGGSTREIGGERIRGKALVLWDPDRPGKKRDSIDTDQITPSADCVSESLDALDERWKAGSFRHLMPDFRQRVHAGETFLVVGARFGIGSSREMSPAGLKAVAEEAGLTLVIVCGAHPGSIFRHNALNIGLDVVECPEAADDAQEGDILSFDPATRELANETRGKRYRPVPLTPQEEEIRRSGGILAVGQREFRTSFRRPPRILFPEPGEARRMTTTEQIVWAHRVDRAAAVRPGATLLVQADLLPVSDGTAPLAIHTFQRITGGDTIFPRQAAIANDHFVFTGREADRRQTEIGQTFAARHQMKAPYVSAPGAGIFHFYFPEQGLIVPGGFYAGADSHSRTYGAYGAVGVGVGSTTVGFGWATGAVYFTLAEQRRVRVTGRLQPWVSGKDIVLHLLRHWGARQARGMGVEFVDEECRLPMSYRHTITNMMAEAEAQNGIFAQDETTETWFRDRGIDLPYPRLAPGEEASYALDEEISLSGIVPLIAKPFRPANAIPAEEVARERITFAKALIGSCTNGGYEDLLAAALVVRAARARNVTRIAPGAAFVIYPGSGTVRAEIEVPDPRLAGESIAAVLRGAGAVIRESWCGPCFGQGPDALARGERAITSFNRNWENRMGVGGKGYLAGPVIVASSALLGYMGPPSELGLVWDPEVFA